MPYYLLQATYSAEARGSMLTNPHNREPEVRQAIEGLGGSLEGFWFSFGEYDIVAIAQFPDNSHATALAMAVSAAGAVSATRITPLLTNDEATAAMQHAADVPYRQPHHPDAGQ